MSTRIQRSALLPYPAQALYDLVNDVASYPQFLPWCDRAAVLERDDAGMTAEVGIAMAGLRQTFVTRNVHEEGRRVQMHLIKGPFSRLEGDWHFHAVADGSQRACRVELLLNYGFESAALAALVGPIFDRIAASMVDAFVKRAEQVYG